MLGCVNAEPARASAIRRRDVFGIASGANDFQGHHATETLVLGTIHVAHRAGTEEGDQAIARQYLADHATL